jgi:hypothetical protein
MQEISVLQSVQTETGEQATFFLSGGSRALSLGVKRTGRGADHSLAYRTQVKEINDMWICTSTHILLHGVHRDSFRNNSRNSATKEESKETNRVRTKDRN